MPYCDSAAWGRAMITGKRILVVEDEFIVAAMLCDVLEDAGAEPVGPVGRVEDALEIIANEAIDAAVLDWNLHGQSGMPLAEALRDRDIPFVIATGYGMVEEAFANQPILGKPYIPEILIEHLKRLLAR